MLPSAITDNLVRCVQTPPVEGIGTIAAGSLAADEPMDSVLLTVCVPLGLSETAQSSKANVLVGCCQDTPAAAEVIGALAPELPDGQLVADGVCPARLIEGSSAAIAITDNLVRYVQLPPLRA